MTDNLYMTGATPDECWPLVRDFHYSRRMPSAIKHCFAWREPGGLFGDTGEPQAAIIYGVPVNRNWPQEAIELQRIVRRDDFTQPLSKFIAWSLRWLKKNTEYPFVLSYADTGKNHHGGIYQASNWVYIGNNERNSFDIDGYIDENKNFIHARTCYDLHGTASRKTILDKFPNWEIVERTGKHIYLYPLMKNALKDYTAVSYPKPDRECA